VQAAQRKEYRTRLFIAAKKIFAEKRRLTANIIASELNISRSSLYRYFTAAAIKAAIRTAREPALKAVFGDEY
jgi:AcrR family transcriptional regulator